MLAIANFKRLPCGLPGDQLAPANLFSFCTLDKAFKLRKKVTQTGGVPMKIRTVPLAAVAACVFVGAAAQAAEVTTYTYDAKGRVVSTSRSDGPANGTSVSYSYDQADNRINVTVANAPNGDSTGQNQTASVSPVLMAVLPLGGYVVVGLNP